MVAAAIASYLRASNEWISADEFGGTLYMILHHILLSESQGIERR